MEPVVVDGVRKEYANKVAVKNSTFSVGEGEILGIIGPNGAGKTTTLKMISGLLEPTDGSVEVMEIQSDKTEMRANIGFLPERSPLEEDMTGVGYLQYFADLYDVPDDVAEERIHTNLDKLGLEQRDKRIGNMSKGMKRKVAIVRSLVNDPDVLIYDEPASGLDPLTTSYVLDFTESLSDDGKTIIFSAHNLYHVERLCDRIVIMNDGDMVYNGDLERLNEEERTVSYTVRTDVPVEGSKDDNGRYSTTVESHAELERVRDEVEKKNGKIVHEEKEQPSLEEVFLNIIGKTGDNDEG